MGSSIFPLLSLRVSGPENSHPKENLLRLMEKLRLLSSSASALFLLWVRGIVLKVTANKL